MTVDCLAKQTFRRRISKWYMYGPPLLSTPTRYVAFQTNALYQSNVSFPYYKFVAFGSLDSAVMITSLDGGSLALRLRRIRITTIQRLQKREMTRYVAIEIGIATDQKE
jgi:hypothetical protein